MQSILAYAPVLGGIVCREPLEGQIPALPGDPGSVGDAAGDGGGEAGGRQPKNGLMLVRGCSSPRKIRASAAVVEAGPILCDACRQELAATS